LGIPEEITTLSTGALILLQKPVNSYTKKPAHSGGFMLALRTGIEPLKITLKSPVSKGSLFGVLNFVLNINWDKWKNLWQKLHS